MQRNEARTLKDIPCHEFHAALSRFFSLKSEKRMVTNMNQGLSCSARWTVNKKGVAETTVFCEIVNFQIQGNNLKRAQGYGKRKNASRALSKADEKSSGVQAILWK